MTDPFFHQAMGPVQIQELQNQINDLREELRRLRPVTTETVKAHETAIGTYYESTPGVTASNPTRQVWL